MQSDMKSGILLHISIFIIYTILSTMIFADNDTFMPVQNGYDPGTGKIVASGFGYPPINAVNHTIGKYMARRAALIDAKRNLLRILQGIETYSVNNSGRYLDSRDYVVRIHGFILGYNVINEQEYPDGRIEIILELFHPGSSGVR